MKKVRIKSLGGKRETPFFEWRFTDGEKDQIHEILKTVIPKPKYRIELFMSDLEGLMMIKKILLEKSSKSDLRAKREKILTDCRATLGHLKNGLIGNDALWALNSLKDYGSLDNDCDLLKFSDLLEDEMFGAYEVIGPLQKFIETLERHHRAEKKKHGRPSADADAFIKMLADIYAEHIGDPSAYEDGPFYALVQAILEIIKLPSKDPSRAIREALSHR